MSAVLLERVREIYHHKTEDWEGIKEELSLEELLPEVFLANTPDGRRIVTISYFQFKLGVGYQREDGKSFWIRTPFLDKIVQTQLENIRRIWDWQNPGEHRCFLTSFHDL